MNLPAAVFFDLDGTLADTETAWRKAEEELCAQAGVAPSNDLLEHLVGVDMDSAARLLIDYTGLKWSVERINAYLLDRVNASLEQGVVWQPGMRELLTFLNTSQVKCGLVTSSPLSMARVVIDHLPKGSFDVIVTGDDVDSPKPHPEPYVRAAGLVGAQARDCIALEDSPTGVKSAMSAGCITVAIPHMVQVPAVKGLSRIPSARYLTAPVMEALMSGSTINNI
ncbi:HAD family hydrolase [Scrofimicrobium canadense]|uniref:HAD family hydrolase n=1 Tax=Scrofimicrobium canadense TaxID=2652290 RepID=UPI0019801197|nr:HAD family phosphatase [Scrofimicrobium canadense]